MLFFCQKSLIFANNMMKNMQIPFKTGCKCPLFSMLDFTYFTVLYNRIYFYAHSVIFHDFLYTI